MPSTCEVLRPTLNTGLYVIKNENVGNTFYMYIAHILSAGIANIVILFVNRNDKKFEHEKNTRVYKYLPP